jgi:hypothetical protein
LPPSAAILSPAGRHPAADGSERRGDHEVRPECGLSYCIKEWDTSVLFDDGLYDRTGGICPDGHRHPLDD